MSENDIEELKKKIADLKKRLPAHTVAPSMILELEELEESLKKMQHKKNNKKDQGMP